MIKSYAIISDGAGHSSMNEIEVRKPAKKEVLIEMKAAGICRTDLNKINGLGESFIPGHEGAGVVVDIGEEVSGVKVGDSVVLNWAMPCQDCFQCDLGNENLCEKNSPIVGGTKYFDRHLRTTLYNKNYIPRLFNLGTFSKHTIVQESAVTKIEVDIAYSTASIISCSVLTGYGSVVNVAKIYPDSSAVVIGCGGIGMNVIQSCKLRKAKTIIAIDSNEGRLQLSKDFGSTHRFLAKREEPDLKSTVLAVKNLLGGRGADFSFECTGIPSLSVVPLAMIRHGGTAVQISGVEQELIVDMNLFEFDKKYINPLYGGSIPRLDIPNILSLYSKKEYKLTEQITETYSIRDFKTVFQKLAQGELLKGVFIMDV